MQGSRSHGHPGTQQDSHQSLRAIAAPLSVDQAHDRVRKHLQAWPILDVTGMVVLETVRGVRDHQFNFWDAQVWAVARLNQIAVVFSEDFNAGAVIEGVRFVNPFAENFQIEEWVASEMTSGPC